MAFSSRPYAPRSFSSSSLPPGVKWLLIANTAIFAIYFLLSHSGGARWLDWAALVPAEALGGFRIWQFVTYLFLHSAGTFWHILLNMLTLYMFGADVERQWGTREFLRYYFLCGGGAGVCVVAAHYLFGNPNSMTIGASGAIYGLLMAFGMTYPDRQILFSFLFPIPAKYFVLILGGIAFLSTFGAGAGGGVSHVAHLGGMIFGFAYLRTRRRRTRTATRPFDPLGWAQTAYREWKMQRAKRKFEVYLRKHRIRD
jgi:membrane associated rhomboid family serine protease